jgi:hypothetical protein
MPSSATRLYRRLRFGQPVVVISGLPRSGTSMAMKMLDCGGVEVVTDDLRVADASNPNGYYEVERVKRLNTDEDRLWLAQARGKAIKIISFLLRYLPDSNDYHVIFMHRRLDEVIESQNAMLMQRDEPAGATSDDALRALYEKHLQQVKSFLTARQSFDVLDVEYAEVLTAPRDEAARMSRFLGRDLDVDRMAAAVDRQLYRQRR